MSRWSSTRTESGRAQVPESASTDARRGRVSISNVVALSALACFLIPFLADRFAKGLDPIDPSLPTDFVIGDLPDDLAPAYIGAFEGGPTGTSDDGKIETVIAEDDLAGGGSGGFDVPTGSLASPLFGAQPFSQRMLRFEEFGLEDIPDNFSVAPEAGFPMPPSSQGFPDGSALDQFLDQPLWPAPTRKSNVEMSNPLRPMIQDFLGRPLDHTPLEGRPPGEGWAHQRWDEFPAVEFFQSAMTGARPNGGLRDSRQRHGFVHGEFGPGGLYHSNVAGNPAFDGTNEGLEIRFHPNMPEQLPHSIWTFDGTLPPKLLVSRIGRGVLFRHHNALPIDPSANRGFGLHTITTHHHNGHNPGESDGYANAFFFPGQYYDYRWPMIPAGYDSENTEALDPRSGCPEDDGTIVNIRGDSREIPSTLWFHDHMFDFTAPNVYKGNAAMNNIYSSVDRGNEAVNDGVNLRLPSGTALPWGNRDYDVNLVIADKAWTPDGQLWFNIFNLDGFVGDQLLTNWLYKPYLDVRARRYRFRILNGSVSRYLKIALVTETGQRVPFHMVANDGNIMEHAVAFDGTLGTEMGVLPTQAIAERYDIVVDFSQFAPGTKLYFVNTMEHKDGRRAEDPIPLGEVLSGEYQAVLEDGVWNDGDPCVGKFLEFRVHEYAGVDQSMDPHDYVTGGLKMLPLNRPTAEELANARHRSFKFGRSSGTDSAPWTVKIDDDEADAADPRRLSSAPTLGSVEIWHIENGGGGWAHPVHVHFEEGIMLSRGGEPPPEWEKWARKDVYRVGPLEESTDTVEIAIRFREFSGTYVEHCHNTQHEDHAMLSRWDIENPGQFLVMPTPLPTWEGVQYVESVALPTFRSGDGFGPTELSISQIATGDDPGLPGGGDSGGGDSGGGDFGGDGSGGGDGGADDGGDFAGGGGSGDADSGNGGPDGGDPPADDGGDLAGDGSGSGGGDAMPGDDPAVDLITVTRCEYDADKRRWRIEGGASDPSATVTAYLGDPADGLTIASSAVEAGEYDIRRRRGPRPTSSGAPSYVTIVSSLGATETSGIEIDD